MKGIYPLSQALLFALCRDTCNSDLDQLDWHFAPAVPKMLNVTGSSVQPWLSLDRDFSILPQTIPSCHTESGPADCAEVCTSIQYVRNYWRSENEDIMIEMQMSNLNTCGLYTAVPLIPRDLDLYLTPSSFRDSCFSQILPSGPQYLKHNTSFGHARNYGKIFIIFVQRYFPRIQGSWSIWSQRAPPLQRHVPCNSSHGPGCPY